MIISQTVGGLGNQMFQFAAGRSLSLRLNKTFKVDSGEFERYQLRNYELENVFDLTGMVADKQNLKDLLGWQYSRFVRRFVLKPYGRFFRKSVFAVEPDLKFWPGFQRLKGDKYLIGFWQSERYFKEYSTQIRDDFKFKIPLSLQNQELADEIDSSTSVSIHVRRADYVSNPDTFKKHGACSLDFYHNAVKYIAEKTLCPRFYIFSDDCEWVRKNLELDFPVVFVQHNKGRESYNDMRLMSMCRHNIIANSTFSWWGAWLNNFPEKIVIAPARWFADNIMQNSAMDICPEEWVRL